RSVPIRTPFPYTTLFRSPWDPFWSEGSEVLLDKTVPVDIDGSPASFRLRAFVLPPRSELSDDQLRDADITADRQGFYVFREDRRSEEHTSELQSRVDIVC